METCRNGRLFRFVPRRHAGLLLWIAMLVAHTPAAFAQVLLSAPNLDIKTDGTVFAIARQSDGGVVFGGSFLSVNGVPRSNIARLLPDGSLDMAWHPSINFSVRALSVDNSDRVFAGGDFSQVNGLNLPFLVRLDGIAGTPTATWLPAPNGSVNALAIHSSSLYVGGSFTQIGGAARAHIARLATSGNGLADAWNPSADKTVYALTVVHPALGLEFIIAGGLFTTIGGQAHSYIAKLLSQSSSADPAWNPSMNGSVLALTNDGTQVYAGGSFTTINSVGRERIGALAATNGQMQAFNPGADNIVYALSVTSTGSIYVGGNFAMIGGLPRNGLAKMTDSGVMDLTWNPGAADTAIYAIRARSDGIVFAGGLFRTLSGQPHVGFARIEADTSSSITSDVELPGTVIALAHAADGSVFVGGKFSRVNGQTHGNLLRLLPDGSLDPAWVPATNGNIMRLAFDSSGRVYAAGQFTYVNGSALRGLVRLAPTGSGTPDFTWNAQVDYFVTAVVVAPNDDVYVGGPFTQIRGVSRNHIARLSPTTAEADPAWNPDADNWVWSLALSDDNALFAGGSFSNIGGMPRAGIAKISLVSGSSDTSWNPGADGPPQDLLVGPDGILYAGGYFTHIGGQTRLAGLARIAGNGIGAVDANWNPPLTGNTLALGMDESGSALYVAGALYPAPYQPQRNNLFKLDPGGTGAIAPGWSFFMSSIPYALIVAENKAWFGGVFESALGTPRTSLGAVALDAIFANGFE